jgi:tetratricopeptide (TPR) repeat protein
MLDSPESAEWMAILGYENANLQAAFAHAVESGNAEYAQRIVASAWRFWQARGHLAEGTTAASTALALEGSSIGVRASALDAAGSIAYWVGDRQATRAYYEEAVAIRRANDQTDGLALALYNLSFPVSDDDGLEAGTILLDEAIALAEEAGDERVLMAVYMSLSRAWIGTSPERAHEFAELAIRYAERVSDPLIRAWARSVQGVILRETGDFPAAVKILQTSLATFRDLEDYSGITVNLAGLANLAEAVDDSAMALYIVGAVWKLRGDTGIGIDTAIDDTVQRYAKQEAVDELPPNLRERYDAGYADPLATSIEAVLRWHVG